MPFEPKYEPLNLTGPLRADLLQRAKVAWFKAGESRNPTEASGVHTRKGLVYVVLRYDAGVLAVYRVRQLESGLMLRRMLRPPASLTA